MISDEKKKFLHKIAFLALLIALGNLVWSFFPNANKHLKLETQHNPYIELAVQGPVKNPGIYQFKKGEKITDIIRQCGGLWYGYRLKSESTHIIAEKPGNFNLFLYTINHKKKQHFGRY